MNGHVAVSSVRGRLAATAIAGFVLTGLMTALVAWTTREARQVVEQAEATMALVGLALAFGFSMAVFVFMAREIAAKQQALEEHARRHTFLADASHELRMPLTIIRGETQVALRAGPQAPEDSTEVLERILEQTGVLTRVFDDLFLIARAEAGGLRLNLRVIDVGELVRRVAQDFSTIACEWGATVRADASIGLFARVDPDRVRQALAALIDNALRHARAGAGTAADGSSGADACVSVRVSVRAVGDSIAITVTDNGRGIDEATASELFARFRRGPTHAEGSGLGLTVVRALAEAHGGTASLGNAEHGGAQATLRLPKNTQRIVESSGGWSNVSAAGGRR